MAKQHWEIVHNNRNVLSDTPEKLWNNAVGYFKWCDENPVVQMIPVLTGKEAGTQIKKTSVRMYTVKALCLHCNIEEEYIKSMRALKNEQSEYYIVVSKILYIIYVQNMEGAASDVFNAGFITKVLNLEKEDNTPKDIKVQLVSDIDNGGDGRLKIPELSESEDQILRKLELELSLAEKSKS